MLISIAVQRSSEKIRNLLDDLVPLDTLPPVLVQRNPKIKARPPLLHYGLPATEIIMAGICAMNGYKERVKHPKWGKFNPRHIFSLGALFISNELETMFRIEIVYGSPTKKIFTFGDSRSTLRSETAKEPMAKLHGYLTANNLPYEKPGWYLDLEHFYWTSYSD